MLPAVLRRTQPGSPRSRPKEPNIMRCRRPLIPIFIVAAAAVAVLAAGCGGGSSPPTSSANRPTSAAAVGKQFVAFAVCMRSHGVPDYPDPQVSSSGNHVQVTISPGSADPNSPAFKSADHACHNLLPNGEGQPRPEPTVPTSRRRICCSRTACARTEYRTSLTPITTEPSPSPPGSTSRRPNSSARRKRARTSSQARSRSSTNLQAAPDAAPASASGRVSLTGGIT